MKRLLALCLILTLLLTMSGCMGFGAIISSALLDQLITDPTGSPEPTEAPAPTETAPPVTVDEELIPKRQANAGSRDYAPDGTVDMVKFSDIPYLRPDVDGLCKAFADLTEMVEAEAEPDAILTAYYAASDAYLDFYTMDSLAYIRYTLDTTDSYYKAEYDALELASPDVEEKLEAFYKACAGSSLRDALERDYFGYGFFDDYEDFSRYTNEEYLALAKQEEELLSQYRTAVEDPKVRYDGRLCSVDELLEDLGEIDSYAKYRRYLDILEAYYGQFNQSVGEIFLKLIPVRRQIAETMGYDSYADYCYDVVYERDYSHDQGLAFLEEIRTRLVPIAEELGMVSMTSSFRHFDLDPSMVTAGLSAAAQNMGGRVEEAFRFMLAYELFDLTSSPTKFNSSFTTYLPMYEAPFLTVNADGTSADYITFSHEFGHFTDAYVTYNAPEDLETAETFSQAMEFLSLCYTDGIFTERQRDALIRQNLLDTMDTFTYQATLAMFEERVYALTDDQLTLDRVNDIYRQCCIDYGVYEQDLDFYYRQGWIDITHFFEVPYYVISYCVSADTALQVYIRETEQEGAGLAVYEKLLDREQSAGVQAVMEDAGLGNPFRADGVQEIVSFYTNVFDLAS